MAQTIYEFKESTCPFCGHKLNRAATTTGKPAPVPGDSTMCLGCGHFVTFDHDMGLRRPTNDELLDVLANPDSQLYLEKFRQHQKQTQQ